VQPAPAVQYVQQAPPQYIQQAPAVEYISPAPLWNI